MKAKATAHEKPVIKQIAECKSFIDRAEKRLAKLDGESVGECSDAAVSVSLPSAILVADMEVELLRLRAELVDARTTGDVCDKKLRVRLPRVPKEMFPGWRI